MVNVRKNLKINFIVIARINLGYSICSNCLKDYLYKTTDEKFILNIYKSNKKEIKYFLPKCYEEIYLSKNLINNLYNDDVYINNAEERLMDEAKIYAVFIEKII